jgi:hypothetical protein
MKKFLTRLAVLTLMMLFAAQVRVAAKTPTLDEVAVAFNNCPTVKEYLEHDIVWKAKVSGDTMDVGWRSGETAYSVTYHLNGTILSVKFPKDNLLGPMTGLLIADCVGYLHGYQYEELMPSLQTDEAGEYTVENEGFQVTKYSNGGGKIAMDLSKKVPLVDMSKVYIRVNNLQSMKQYIAGDGFASCSKGNVSFSKQTDGTDYVILIGEKDKLTSCAYNSILSVLTVMFNDEKVVADFQKNYPDFSAGNKSFSKFKIELNPKLSDRDINRDGYKYVRITVKNMTTEKKSTIKVTVNSILKTPTAKIKASKKAFKLKVTAVKGQTGISIRYKKSGAKKWTTKSFKTTKSISKKIKKLKSKKTYTVQVRAFCKKGSTKLYSKWTKAKKIKIK